MNETYLLVGYLATMYRVKGVMQGLVKEGMKGDSATVASFKGLT
jgi:hypothetical protein